MIKYINKNLQKYANIFFESLKGSEDIENVSVELNSLKSHINEIYKEAKGVGLFNMKTDLQKEVFEEIMNKIGIKSKLKDFVLTLVELQESKILKEFVENWDRLKLKYLGYKYITVTTAKNLTKDQKEKLTSKLDNIFNKKYYLEVVLDESILGGLDFQVDDVEINDSVLSKLNNFNKNLKGSKYNG